MSVKQQRKLPHDPLHNRMYSPIFFIKPPTATVRSFFAVRLIFVDVRLDSAAATLCLPLHRPLVLSRYSALTDERSEIWSCQHPHKPNYPCQLV